MRNPNLVPKSDLSAQINACQAEPWSELGQMHILLVWLPGLELTHTDTQHSAIEVNLLGVWPQKDTDKEALSISHTQKNILGFIYIKKSRHRDVENIVRSLIAQQGQNSKLSHNPFFTPSRFVSLIKVKENIRFLLKETLF